jgi:prophage regulatory protein
MSDQSNLPATGFVRLAAILGPRGPIPVSRSTWWAGVKSGRFPQPLKLGPRITVWRVEEIRALIEVGVPAGEPLLPRLEEPRAHSTTIEAARPDRPVRGKDPVLRVRRLKGDEVA